MADTTVCFGDYELDFARRELRRSGAPVAVQLTPLRVLLYLAEHRDRTVPRRELLDAIWPGVVVGDEALTSALGHARQAVGDGGDAQRMLRTLKGQGYRFVAEVRAAAPAPHQPAPPSRRGERALTALGGVMPLPSGIVTFVFTGIEGSTRLLLRLGDRYPAVLDRHRELLRTAWQSHSGAEVETEGDAFFVAFADPSAAVAACAAAQRALLNEDWPTDGTVRVRMGVHSGLAYPRGDGYVALAVHQAARIAAAGHGGQVLLSAATQQLVRYMLPAGTELRDLGEHGLKDLMRPEGLYQLVVAGLPADFPPLRTLDARPHNLPTQATAMIGREREVAAIRAHLRQPDVRLLTLTGAGGSGKTRLALQVASEALDDFADGIFFVALAPIRDSALVLPTIAHVLGVQERSDTPLVENLTAALRHKDLLLVLDNFEQVLGAGPPLAHLLTAVPKLKALVTSRAVLHVYGEREVSVPPLQLPDLIHLPPLDQLTQYEAVRLFVARTVDVRPDFALTKETAPVVAAICHRLDGLPLAIELAAVRLRLLSPLALLDRLDRRLPLLTGGARNVPVRQQTLRGTIAWSYDLLSEAEQTLFRRLAVCVGGCTLDAAAAVCSVDGDLPIDVLDGVGSLVDQSLLRQPDTVDDEPRVFMLETIREFGLERLAADPTRDIVRSQHAQYVTALAEAAEPRLTSSGWAVWLRRLYAERDNIRAALGWVVEHAAVDVGLHVVGLRLVGALYPFWGALHLGNVREAQAWAEQVLALPGAEQRTAARARALITAGRLAWTRMEFRAAAARFKEAIAIAREVSDEHTLAHALLRLGATYRARSPATAGLLHEAEAVARRTGDTTCLAETLRWQGFHALDGDNRTAARTLLEESQQVAQRAGSPVTLALATWDLAGLALSERDDERARAYFTEARHLAYDLGDRLILSSVLCGLAYLALFDGEVSAAIPLLEEGLDHGQASEYLAGIVENLDAVARVAAGRGDAAIAARLLGAAAVHDSTGLMPAHAMLAQQTRTSVRSALGENSFTQAWGAGAALTLEEAIRLALTEVRHA